MLRKNPSRKTRKKKYNSGISWLSNKQMKKLRPFFPKSRGKPRVDDQQVLRMYVQQVGSRWQYALPTYGPHKTLYTRWRRWCKKMWFVKMLQKMAEQSEELGGTMINATYSKAHRTACSLACHAGESGRLIGKTKGSHNTKVNAVWDRKGWIIDMRLTKGNVRD